VAVRVHPRSHHKARNASGEAGVKAMLAYEPARTRHRLVRRTPAASGEQRTATVRKQHVEVAVDVRRRDRTRDRAAAGQCDARREGAVARVEQHSAWTAIVPKQHSAGTAIVPKQHVEVAKQHVEVAVAVDVRRRDRATHVARAIVEATVAVRRVSVRLAEARAAVKAGKTRVGARVAAAVAVARAAAAATAAAVVESALAAGLVAEARAAC